MLQLGCQLTSSLSINLELNFCSLVFLDSILKSPNLHLSYPPMQLLLLQMLVILVLSSTYLSHSQIIFHPCLNHTFYPFVTFVESAALLTIPCTARTIATFLNLPRRQLDRLQLILNSAVNSGCFYNPALRPYLTILKSLYWLKIDQRI